MERIFKKFRGRNLLSLKIRIYLKILTKNKLAQMKHKKHIYKKIMSQIRESLKGEKKVNRTEYQNNSKQEFSNI